MKGRVPLLLLLSALQVWTIALTDRATASDVGRSDQLRLVHVAVLFRHGERASLTTFPGDPNQHYVWPMGRGQLTNRGRQTMWALGTWLRERYAHFLTYDVREVSARSSPVPRCFDSCAILLYGLYPVIDKGRQWKRGQDWQPVPITSPPDGTDKYATLCLPRFLDSLSALYAAEVPCSLVGEPSAKPPSMRPGYAAGGLTLTQGKDDTNTGPKVTLFSYHDMNVAGVILGMNGTLSGRPPYGAAVIIEVFTRSGASEATAERYVRLFYKASDQHATSIPVEGCADPCPLQKFDEVLQRKFEPVTRARCGWTEHQPLL
ncbi:hypothetical protein HPB49_020309 [Dermacentor silvarum]|uniref:Uncharacterized protein n=1 Tax=Dermacentor silvarum TaxID=543639 RepID=A0ACB8CMD9_DERSI|nr:hypothetical protein HPB49_020309 [Dermacentor silvarum]